MFAKKMKGAAKGSKRERRTREAFAEVAYSNMVMIRVLLGLLTKKGLISMKEVLQGIDQMDRQMRDEKQELLGRTVRKKVAG